MTILILYFLLVLLLLGCYTDLKYRYVSPLITVPFFILGSAVVVYNSQDLVYQSRLINVGLWSVLQVVTLLFFFVSYKAKLLGSADFIVLAPIIFLVNSLMIFLFSMWAASVILLLIYKDKIPLFLAITAGFLIAIG